MPARFGGSRGGGVAVAAAGGVPPHMMAFRAPPAYKVDAENGPAYTPPPRAAFPPAAAYASGGYTCGREVEQEMAVSAAAACAQPASLPRDRATAAAPGRSMLGTCDLCARARRTVVMGEDGRLYCKVCRLQQTGATKAWHSVAKGANMAVDSDEELVGLCRACGLPLGESVYFDEEKKATVHGECMAARILKGAQEGENALQQAAAAEKRRHREAYDIGWKAEHVPSNVVPARKLGRELSSKHGLCCLALEGDTRTLQVTESEETAAGVNLEYLSLALRVRRSEGREPLFSLDPVDLIADPERLMQAKRFEPTWLMGTSAGEVMFQADYYLKELSMGQFKQPMPGMVSCWDFADGNAAGPDWDARIWFVVLEAEVNISEDDVLIPCVKMGVEARELVSGSYEDAAVTRKDHPLVKYAEMFTQSFDAIAERVSVVYYLRELAKASALAKFLIDNGYSADSAWLHLAADTGECQMEAPRLWNRRLSGTSSGPASVQLAMQEGSTNMLWGGVDLSLQKFVFDQAKVKRVAARLCLDSTDSSACKTPGESVDGFFVY
uniref:Uncharacterized protein n=1 Tax=Alexandrium monilatum TaxID=311494 RepID=A0A7S4T227_9DINO